MPDYRYILVDASSGDSIDELPLTVPNFTYLLNGCGQLAATMPLDDPKNIEAYFEGDRELTVHRDGVAVWNGPLTGVPKSNRRGGVLNLNFREASWYFWKRVIEATLTYTGEDLFDILRDIWTVLTTKVATGSDGMTAGDDIVAAVPRFFVMSGLAGVSRDLTISGAALMKFADVLAQLVTDTDNGIDWRMDYAGGLTQQSCDRTLMLGTPQLGVEQDIELTEHLLYDYWRANDYEQGANRAHARGANGYVKTRQNPDQVTAGRLLLEDVFDASDVTDTSAVDAFAGDVMRAYAPPIHDRGVSFIPGVTLPFGWCAVGDTLKHNISGPGFLQITAQKRRLVQVTVAPTGGDEGQEVVDLQTSLVTSDLGG